MFPINNPKQCDVPQTEAHFCQRGEYISVYTVDQVPHMQSFGIVMAKVSCISSYVFKFEQNTVDQLMRDLLDESRRKGGDSVIGVNFQMMDIRSGNSIQYYMAAFGTAVKANAAATSVTPSAAATSPISSTVNYRQAVDKIG